MRRSTRIRSPARIFGHGPSSKARRAARTAASTSSGPAIGNEATSSPVAGWLWFQPSPDWPAVHAPSISIRPSDRPISSRCGLIDATMAKPLSRTRSSRCERTPDPAPPARWPAWLAALAGDLRPGGRRGLRTDGCRGVRQRDPVQPWRGDVLARCHDPVGERHVARAGAELAHHEPRGGLVQHGQALALAFGLEEYVVLAGVDGLGEPGVDADGG